MRHQILQRLINAGLCVTALYLNMLTVHIEGCIHNGFLQILHSGQLIPASFILLVTDDVLHGLRKLGDVSLLHELADFHSAFQCLIVGSTGKNDDSLPLRFRHKAQLRFLHGIGCDRKETQLHTTGHCTRGHAINHLVEVEVILAVAVFLSLVDISVNHLSNALNDRCRIHVGVLDILLDVLFLIGQEVIRVAGSADVVLAHETVQGLSDLFTEHDLICADIIGHQDHDVVHIGRDVIHIADQVQELQNINVHSLYSRPNIRCILAALDHTANGTVKEGMYGIVEAEERNQRIFVLILNLLRGFLETGQHGTLTTRKVFARVAMFADLSKDFLHDDELIRHKREVHCELVCSGKALDIQNGVREAKEIAKDRVIFMVEAFQLLLDIGLFLQDTLLDNLIHGGGRQGETGFETRLNSGELIGTNLDDFINGFLPGTHDPNFAAAFAADLFSQRLEVQEHVSVRSDVLANFVNQEDQPEVLRLLFHVSFDIFNQLGNGKLDRRLVVEPALCIFFAHVQNFHQRRNDKLAVECKGLSLINPRLALLGLKDATEFFGLTKLINVLLQHGNLQVLAKENKMVIEHLCKDAEHRSLVFVDRAFNVDVEKNSLSLATGSLVDQHERSRIIRKLLAEHFDRRNTANRLVLKDVGKHLQEVRFTTSKEAGNPHSDIVRRLIKGVAIIVKEADEVLL